MVCGNGLGKEEGVAKDRIPQPFQVGGLAQGGERGWFCVRGRHACMRTASFVWVSLWVPAPTTSASGAACVCVPACHLRGPVVHRQVGAPGLGNIWIREHIPQLHNGGERSSEGMSFKFSDCKGNSRRFILFRLPPFLFKLWNTGAPHLVSWEQRLGHCAYDLI